MGVFDVRCAVSGLVLRSGRTLVVPVVRAEKKTFMPVGLPIAGK